MTSTNLKSPRFPLLVRTGDGRLVMPTAIPAVGRSIVCGRLLRDVNETRTFRLPNC